MLRTLTVMMALLGASLSAQAELIRGMRLGYPTVWGSGCNPTTVNAILSPDEDAISILFNDFIVEAGSTGKKNARKNCDITLPVTVPQGYSIGVIQTDYRGFNVIPGRGANTRLSSEYFWSGFRGPVFNHSFAGPNNQDFTVSNGIVTQNTVWTPCGASVNLRIKTSIMAESNERMEQTMMGIDSADISSGLIYHIQWRRCGF